MKNSSVTTWHYQSSEAKHLKKSRLGPPDLYPQDARQEEDNLGADRLKKGYQVAVTSYEHDSIVWNAKVLRLDRLDETMLRGAQIVMQIMTKKCELNASLDRDRKRAVKDGYFQSFTHTVEKSGKSKERKEWFMDLSGGKPLSSLAKRPPFFRKKEDALEYLCDYKVPASRAVWFLKLLAVGQGITSAVNKQKKSTSDHLASEHASVFSKYVKLMLNQMSDSAKLESNIVYTDRWPHFVCICKHAYEDGMIDKQEFLMDLCDIFGERFLQSYSQKKQHFLILFRLFLSFLAQYTDQITQSLILARRCSFLVAKRLANFLEEYSHHSGRPVSAEESFDDMLQCVHQRAILLILSGLLYAIIIDSPGALVWNNFKVSHGRPPPLLHQMCGSPLDLLSCRVQSLPIISTGYSTHKLQQFIAVRIEEIKRRSRAVENHWSISHAKKGDFAKIVNVCLEILGVLDAARLDEPNVIEKLYTTIFDTPSNESFEHEHAIRVKILLHWAVSAQREGTHRALIVANLLAFRVNHRKTFKFGKLSLQDAITEYLLTEGSDLCGKHFKAEFSNLMLLMLELQRFGIFSHDCYVKELIRNGDVSQHTPLLHSIKQREIGKEEGKKHENEVANERPNNPDSQDQLFKTSTIKKTDEKDPFGTALTSFYSNALSPHGSDIPQKITGSQSPHIFPSHFEVGMPSDTQDLHILLDDNLTFNERFLIHTPIPQTDDCRSECNQRSLLLYGIGTNRDSIKLELKKLARELTKIWSKRIIYEFSFLKPQEIRFKKRNTRDQIKEFRAQTYYDQVVVCGWCCDNFMTMINDFITGQNNALPALEGLDVLLSMMEECQNIAGIVEFADELIPQLIIVDDILHSRRVDFLPSIISTQLAYVVVAYISHNLYYFLYSEAAASVISGLYRLIEKQLKAEDSYMTCWARAIAVFVLDMKKSLISIGVVGEKIEGNRTLLSRLVPPWKPSSMSGENSLMSINSKGFMSQLQLKISNFDGNVFKEFLDDPKRLITFNDFRRLTGILLRSDGADIARQQFVVLAINQAVSFGHNYEKLIELANLCGHVTAQVHLSQISIDWCGAIQSLCCNSRNNNFCCELWNKIDIANPKSHYNIAVFYMLLASRYCFSINTLLHQLLHSVLKSLINCNSSKSLEVDLEAGVSLALLIIACITCQSDKPVKLPKEYFDSAVHSDYETKDSIRRHIVQLSDRWILTEALINDVGDDICSLLITITMMGDYIQSKLRDKSAFDERRCESQFHHDFVSEMCKIVLNVICEQEWVTNQFYRRCEDSKFEAFSTHQMRRNCLGQQLLRMALRRRCERITLNELKICNGNSKKSLIDKLFSVLSLWNIRATYFDLKLMIKEISPDGSSSNKHAQQIAIAADALIGEIGKSCRDLFKSNCNDLNNDISSGNRFRFKHITAYWLISSLIDHCPKPSNLPASFYVFSIQAKFLKEAALMLDTTIDPSNERLQQTVWLLSQEPFLNLILTCLRGDQQQCDSLVGSLLKHLQELINKVKENPMLPYSRKFSLEREGLLLRLSLVGGIFDMMISSISDSDTWALILYQLMLYGIVSKERDGDLFDACFDMLSTLLISSITDPNGVVPISPQDPDTKYRFATYSIIVKKLRKELSDRSLIPELRCLTQFLPIPKSTFDVITSEQYGTVWTSPQKIAKNMSCSLINKPNRSGLQYSEKVKLSPYDVLQNLNCEVSSKRTWSWAMFQAVKSDRLPIEVQRYIQRIIHHSHYAEFARPTISGMERPPNLDIYLSPPLMDVSETSVSSLHHTVSSSTATTLPSSSSLSSSLSSSTTTVTTMTNPVLSVTSAGSSTSLSASAGDVEMTSQPNSETNSTMQSRSINYHNMQSTMASTHALGDSSSLTFPHGGVAPPPIADIISSSGSTSHAASPRGARGGRRKAGTSNRSQGPTRKRTQRQSNTANSAATSGVVAVDHLTTQQPPNNSNVQSGGSGIALNTGSTGMVPNSAGIPSGAPTSFGWIPQSNQNSQMQPFSLTPQSVNQSEDSKMKIHSMILQKRQQAQATSSGALSDSYQPISSNSVVNQYGQLMAKMENSTMHIDQQYTSHENQSAFNSSQRIYGQQTTNAYENRMINQQQTNPMQYQQQQQQQQYQY